MIKNLLYSLCLHSLLALAIYSSFQLKNFDEKKTDEIAISLIAMDNRNENSVAPKASSELQKKPADSQIAKQKEEVAKPEVQEKSPKKPAAKPVKPANVKPIPKTLEPEKKPEFQQKTEDSKTVPEPEAAQVHEDKKIPETEVKKEVAETEPGKKDSQTSELPGGLENLGLSAREKFNIQSQFRGCFRRAISQTKTSSRIKVVIKVNISKEGYVESDIDKLINPEYYNDPNDTRYRNSIDNVRRALEICSPLRNLPLDKYEIWKEVILEFDEDEVR